MLNVYIGFLDDKDFNYEGGDWNGNVPKRQSPFFPFGNDAYFMLLKKIKNDDYEGKKTDWSGYVAKVDKKQIIEFVDELKEKHKSLLKFSDYGFPTIYDYINSLEDDKLYALVGVEI